MCKNEDDKQENTAETSASELSDLLSATWELGAVDRGMGRYSFAVIIAGTNNIVVKCGTDKELADHIITTHNETLSR